ncbi:MAG: amidohydrolase family protein [Rhodothermales bacterium]
MRIDAHHHFWRYTPDEFGWIDESMQAIRRDFGPSDLKAVLDASGVDGAVAVQARQSLEETAWLLALAEEHDWMRGVVGWVQLVEANVDAVLAQIAANPKLVGVRHVLHDDPDDDYMLREDFSRGIRALKAHDLVYDILIFERHLRQSLTFVDRHPNQAFVLDHVAKPRIEAGELEPWRMHIRALAERPNVTCKVSGMVTEADWSTWTPEVLRPYWATVLEAFGPSRLMFGSDWPVCLVASSYARWVETVQSWMADLSADEQAQIMGGTAARVYGLDTQEAA